MRDYDIIEDEPFRVPSLVRDKIIKDYLQSRYTWVVGVGLFIVGFLMGVIAAS